MQGLVQARGMGLGASSHRVLGQVREMNLIEKTLASQAAYTAPWKQQEKLQEEVTEEFGAHAGPGWSEALCGKVGPAGGSRSWCFEVWLS